MPSKAMYWITHPSFTNANGFFFEIASDAYATDLYLGGNNPSILHIFCNLSDIPNNTYSAYGASNVKSGTCGMMYGGLGDLPYTGLTN